MKSEWKVTANPIGENYALKYSVFRWKDTAEVEYTGNMEFLDGFGYVEDEAIAAEKAEELNAVDKALSDYGTRVIENANGHRYLVMDSDDKHDTLFLKDITTDEFDTSSASEFVIATGFDAKTGTWDFGHYTSSYWSAKEYFEHPGSGERDLPDKIRLFVDMDGTLCKFTPVDTLEKLYQEGWFANAEPHEEVIDAVKAVITDMSEDVEVFVLTSYLADSKYAFYEKQEWLDKYLPEIKNDHRIYVECGRSKSSPYNWLWPDDIDENNGRFLIGSDEVRDSYARGYFLRNGLGDNDFLLDDYTKNLLDWEPPGKGLKLLNGINHTKGTWKSTLIPMKEAFSDIKKALNYSGDSILSDYGYTDPHMVRVSKEDALSFWDNNAVQVFRLYQDNTESACESREDITGFDGFLGVEDEDWRRVRLSGNSKGLSSQGEKESRTRGGISAPYIPANTGIGPIAKQKSEDLEIEM